MELLEGRDRAGLCGHAERVLGGEGGLRRRYLVPRRARSVRDHPWGHWVTVGVGVVVVEVEEDACDARVGLEHPPRLGEGGTPIGLEVPCLSVREIVVTYGRAALDDEHPTAERHG